jgi:hypothetical protein
MDLLARHAEVRNDRAGTLSLWARVGGGIARRPRVVWLTTVAVLGVVALGLTELKADGLSTADSFVTKPGSVLGAQVQAAHFAAGGGQPVVVVGAPAAATRLRDTLTAMPGITDVTSPTMAGEHVYLEGTLLDPRTAKPHRPPSRAYVRPRTVSAARTRWLADRPRSSSTPTVRPFTIEAASSRSFSSSYW